MSEKDTSYLEDTFRKLDAYKKKSYEVPFVLDEEAAAEVKGHIALFRKHRDQIVKYLEDIRLGKADGTVVEKQKNYDLIEDSNFSVELEPLGIESELLDIIEERVIDKYREKKMEWLDRPESERSGYTSDYDNDIHDDEVFGLFFDKYYAHWFGHGPILETSGAMKAAVNNMMKVHDNLVRGTNSIFFDTTLFKRTGKGVVYFHTLGEQCSIHDLTREMFSEKTLEEVKALLTTQSVSLMQVMKLRRMKVLPRGEYVIPYVLKGKIVGFPFRVNKRSPIIEYGSSRNDYCFGQNGRKKRPTGESYYGGYRHIFDFLDNGSDDIHRLGDVWHQHRIPIDEHIIKKDTTVLLWDPEPLSPEEEDNRRLTPVSR